MKKSLELENEKIGSLLIKQAVPASVGFLVLSIYTVVDTIFVGRWVGAMGIGAVSVVAPVHFLISSIGMAIGIGGASIISRAMGAKDHHKSVLTFGNMMGLTLFLSLVFIFVGYVFKKELLIGFGAKGDILPYAIDYLNYLLPSVPLLAWSMMCNNVIRAQGHPKAAMMVMILPSISNMIMDPIFIVYLQMGIKGAALSTTIAYLFSALYTLRFLLYGKNEIKINRLYYFIPQTYIVKDIFKIGGVTIVRQGTISILSILVNHTLFHYGSENDVAIYGIASRLMMFSLFPLLGIMQGFMPIVGYNHGAQSFKRVVESIKTSIIYSTLVSLIIFFILEGLANKIVLLFSSEKILINEAPIAIRMIFLSLPILGIQFISSAYFQTIGKALPALFLTIIKQVLLLPPLIIIFPMFWEIKGIWAAFPVSDVIASGICWWFLNKETSVYIASDH